MIIGEKNIIIGKINAIISEYSISIFFYISKQFNYSLKCLDLFFFKITEANNSPPKMIRNKIQNKNKGE